MFKTWTFIALMAFTVAGYAAVPGGPASAEEFCSFTGRVLDDANLEALTGAKVYIVELDKSVYVDFEGFFTFENIPAGSYTIEISYVSYAHEIHQNVALTKQVSEKRFLLSSF